MEVVEALWPMNNVFRAHHAQIAGLAYAAELESEADAALRVLVDGGSWTAASPSAGVWRVLMERHIQSLTVALANHAQGNKRVVSIPQDLPQPAHRVAAMLWLQWAMVLPFPIESRQSYQWPGAPAPDSLTLQ